MKKPAVILILFLSLLFITGCEEDPPPNPIVPYEPIIEITITPNPPTYGNFVNFNWTVAPNSEINSVSVFIEDTLISSKMTGEYRIGPIKKEFEVSVSVFVKGRIAPFQKIEKVIPQDVFPRPVLTVSMDIGENPLPPEGGIVNFSWTSEYMDTLFYKNVPYGPSGSIQEFVSVTSTFQFIGKGKGGETIVYKVVTVLPPPPPPPPPPTPLELLLEFLRDGRWYMHDVWFIYPTTRYQYFPSECWMDDYELFREDGMRETHRVGIPCEGQTGSFIFYTEYSFDGDSIYIYPVGSGGQNHLIAFHVLFLNDTMMIHRSLRLLVSEPDTSYRLPVEVTLKQWQLPVGDSGVNPATNSGVNPTTHFELYPATHSGVKHAIDSVANPATFLW